MHYLALALFALLGDLALALLVAAFMRAGRGDRSEAPPAQRQLAPMPRNVLRLPVPVRFR